MRNFLGIGVTVWSYESEEKQKEDTHKESVSVMPVLNFGPASTLKKISKSK